MEKIVTFVSLPGIYVPCLNEGINWEILFLQGDRKTNQDFKALHVGRSVDMTE